ncbi:unnamed protein product [Nesidiocoris tenuis]|uniref:Uncharacterized protein n=1 Tax=Nesidiocoris tenuis TaxID=355587 RepID=A0A6H5FU13_9HEMI|nr:unnamed protein product [Nesidiocoris tenuis]
MPKKPHTFGSHGLGYVPPSASNLFNAVLQAKIEQVHTAARGGDLRGVQTALDRRKFAVARDNSTPLKPTPLHVAALFGRTSVSAIRKIKISKTAD